MAILRVNAADDGQVFHAGGDFSGGGRNVGGEWESRLRDHLADLPARAPVVVLLHGLRYSWRGGRGCDPHETLYRAGPLPPSRQTRPPLANWPHALGFSEGGREDGLCVALGWDAGRLGDFRAAQAAADRAAPALAAIADVAAAAGRRIDCVGHSLGARLILSAMLARPEMAVRRAILLGPAERRGAALAAAERASETGGAEFLHVLARANDLFDEIFHRLFPRDRDGCGLPLGALGLGDRRANWMDLQIDHDETRAWLARLGEAPRRRAERVSHWIYYSEPAAMALYARVLRDPASSALATLRRLGAPEAIAPRWSRLASLSLPSAPGRRRATGNDAVGPVEPVGAAT